LVLHASADSLIGTQRSNNEDAFLTDELNGIFVVADGMGGHDNGEVASRMAVSVLSNALQRAGSPKENQLPPLDCMRQAFATCNERITTVARLCRCGKMGTTAILAAVVGCDLHIAWLGDSRAYIIREGTIDRMTYDHTLTEALVRQGQMTETEATRSRWRNVLVSYLGNQRVNDPPDAQSLRLQDGDRLLLATDGLTNVLPEETLRQLVDAAVTPDEAVETLLDAAILESAPDDATCVVVFFDENPVERDERWRSRK
jgi:protein phosphatase